MKPDGCHSILVSHTIRSGDDVTFRLTEMGPSGLWSQNIFWREHHVVYIRRYGDNWHH